MVERHGVELSFHVFVTKKSKYPFELGSDIDHIGSLLYFLLTAVTHTNGIEREHE